MISELEPMMLKEFKDEKLLKEERVADVNIENMKKRSDILKEVQKEIKEMHTE